jgi:ribonuclease HI
MARVTVYTDGSSRGNPGPGGYGAVLLSGELKKELSGGFRHTTNNRMELLSVIVALEHMKGTGHQILVYSDSKYVVDAIEKKWVFGWQKKAFKGKKNADLWRRFLAVYPRNQVRFQWVKGHDGNFYNEICDELAVNAATSSGLKPDQVFEMESGFTG